jgi:hypothetical protein
MASSGRVALVRTDVSEELSASFIRVTKIGELGTTLAITSNRRTLPPILPINIILWLRQPQATVQLEGLAERKNSVTLSEIDSRPSDLQHSAPRYSEPDVSSVAALGTRKQNIKTKTNSSAFS